MVEEENNEELDMENKEEYEELTKEELEMYDILRFSLNNLNNDRIYEIVAEKYRNELLKIFPLPTPNQFIKKISAESLRYINENLVRTLFENLEYRKYHLFDILTNASDIIEISQNGFITYEITFYKKFTITRAELGKVKLNYNEMSNSDKADITLEIGEIELNKDITTFYKTLLQYLSRFVSDP